MADKLWLWSQAGVFVIVALAVAIGLWLTTGENHIENEFTVSINASFLGPGLLLSLAINQVVLLLRRPRVTTTADRVVLSIEYFLIAALILCNFSIEATLLAGGFSVLLVLSGLASLIVIIVGNSRPRPMMPSPAR